MLWILASSAYSFHQQLPPWLWSPAGCILESVLGPWGSSGILYSGRLPLSSFSCVSGPPFLPVAYLPFPIAPFLPPISFPSFLPSFPPYHLPPFSFLSSLAPPVAFCPPMVRLFLPSLFCLFLLLLCCLLSFPFSLPFVSSCLCSSIASHLPSAVASCPLSSLPVISFRPSPPGRR